MPNLDSGTSREFRDQIRPVKPEDTEYLKAIIDATGLFPSEMLDGMMAEHLDGDAADEFWLTVADAQPEAIAYCAPEQMTEGVWNLLLIAVHPDRQSHGIGAALLGYVEEQLVLRDARLLLVETSGMPSFERTRDFYRRNGFAEEARIRDYYEPGDDKVVYRKTLSGTSAE